jgi:perosamine synthetase
MSSLKLAPDKLSSAIDANAFHWPFFTDQARIRLQELLTKPWFADHSTVEEFEEALARWLDIRYVITQSSGTSALEAALFAVGVGPGDEIVGPTLSYWSCVLPAARLGASIVLVDAERDRLTICPAAVAQAITSRTRAVIAVHLHGQLARMEELRQICQQRGVALVEDASHLGGASTRQGRAGALGDVSIFSLNGKVFCCGEGGALATNVLEYYGRAVRWGLPDRALSGKLDQLAEYRGVSLGGVTCRIANTTAALGIDQLSGLDAAFVVIDAAMSRLTMRICDSGLLLETVSEGRGAWHETFLAAPGLSSDQLIKVAAVCRSQGLDVHAFREKRRPLHKHPWFRPPQDAARELSPFRPIVIRRGVLRHAELHDGLVIPRLTRCREDEVLGVASLIMDAIAQVAERT